MQMLKRTLFGQNLELRKIILSTRTAAHRSGAGPRCIICINLRVMDHSLPIIANNERAGATVLRKFESTFLIHPATLALHLQMFSWCCGTRRYERVDPNRDRRNRLARLDVEDEFLNGTSFASLSLALTPLFCRLLFSTSLLFVFIINFRLRAILSLLPECTFLPRALSYLRVLQMIS